jgi:hypothetical protein
VLSFTPSTYIPGKYLKLDHDIYSSNHYLLISLTLDATRPELLTESLNKPQIKDEEKEINAEGE